MEPGSLTGFGELVTSPASDEVRCVVLCCVGMCCVVLCCVVLSCAISQA